VAGLRLCSNSDNERQKNFLFRGEMHRMQSIIRGCFFLTRKKQIAFAISKRFLLLFAFKKQEENTGDKNT